MENEVIVKVENVSIKFCLASEKFDGFKEYFIQRVKKKITYQDFWALQDVSFEVYKGETLGLIAFSDTVWRKRKWKEHDVENHCRCHEANPRQC